MDEKSVVIMSTRDIINRTETMTPATTFSQGRFTQGPSTSLSLQSSSRKTVALGSSTPARAWTPGRDDPERRARDEHDAGGQDHHGAEHSVEELGVAETPVQGVVGAEDVAEGVGGGEGDRGGADDGGVQQDDGEDGAGRAADVVLQALGHAAGVGEVAEQRRVPRRRRRRTAMSRAAAKTTTSDPMTVSARS